MKRMSLFLLLLLVSSAFVTGTALAADNHQPRGRYIYDEAGRISLESQLGLSAYLWKLDVKSGYEIVVVFPKEKPAPGQEVEWMGSWFDSHGVGKKDKDNGLAIFIFPDNSAYGMIGKGHDRIAVPYLSTFGSQALQGLDKDLVLSTLNLLNVLGKPLDEPTTTEQVKSFAFDNAGLIMTLVTLIAFVLLYLQQGDGFQVEDLTIPAIASVIMLAIIFVPALLSMASSEIMTEYGVITDVHTDWHTYEEAVPHTDSKGNTYYTYVTHKVYTNDVGIITYDFQTGGYQFSTEDYPGAWNDHHPGDFVAVGTSAKKFAIIWADGFNDKSGGTTNRYGTWMDWNVTQATNNTTA
jgi:hypothetical protein